MYELTLWKKLLGCCQNRQRVHGSIFGALPEINLEIPHSSPDLRDLHIVRRRSSAPPYDLFPFSVGIGRPPLTFAQFWLDFTRMGPIMLGFGPGRIGSDRLFNDDSQNPVQSVMFRLSMTFSHGAHLPFRRRA